MSSASDFQLDHALIRRRFNARAGTVAKVDFLAREVASRMAERLDYIRLTPERILDLGCGHGPDLPILAQHYPQADCLGLDLTLPLLKGIPGERTLLQRLLGKSASARHAICADALALPLAARCIDLVWSNLLLNWLNDPLPALREIHRVLRVDGLLMFATLGPDTLKELRAALPAHAGERVHRFIDMHDLGDCLVQAGFTDPVMDMQRLTLTYASVDELLADLRNSGAGNAAANRPRGLSGKQSWRAARAALEETRQDQRLPVTIELVFGHAWKAAPRQIEDGRAVVSFRPRR